MAEIISNDPIIREELPAIIGGITCFGVLGKFPLGTTMAVGGQSVTVEQPGYTSAIHAYPGSYLRQWGNVSSGGPIQLEGILNDEDRRHPHAAYSDFMTTRPTQQHLAMVDCIRKRTGSDRSGRSPGYIHYLFEMNKGSADALVNLIVNGHPKAFRAFIANTVELTLPHTSETRAHFGSEKRVHHPSKGVALIDYSKIREVMAASKLRGQTEAKHTVLPRVWPSALATIDY